MSNMSRSDLTFHQINPFDDYELAKNIWQEVEKNADNSFYLSWVWMENWLNCLSNDQNILLVYATLEESTVFCYFIGLKRGLDNKITYCTRAYLNKTGDRDKDSITVEYNGILATRTFIKSDFTSVFQGTNGWSELIAGFIEQGQSKYFSLSNQQFNHRIEEQDRGYAVDLEKVRQLGGDLLPMLSSNKRSQIRRSIRAYEKNGRIKIERADSPKKVADTFYHLKKMHQESWINKGQSSSFCGGFSKVFHDRLIKKYHVTNKIDLLTIYCGNKIIGCLYNFIYKKRVYFYQSGFQYQAGNVFRPGLICHLLAVNLYASEDLNSYDMLVGDMSYKKSLATNDYLMPSYRLRKNLIRFKVEDSLRKCKQKYQ